MLTTAVRAALRRKATGCQFSLDDSRDHMTVPLGSVKVALPDSAMDLDRLLDLRSQGPINQCVLGATDYGVQALCGLGLGPIDPSGKRREYSLRSTLAPYWWARVLGGLQARDGGCFMRDGLRGYSHQGAPTDAAWPSLRIVNVNRQPGPNCYRLGHSWRGLRYSRILDADKPRAVRAALARKRPVLGGWSIGKEFQRDDGADTVITTGAGLGGHAMMVSGYEGGRFRVPNTWGGDWRDGGRVWFTEDALDEARELWALEGWL